jgi:hypothetical protein
MKDKIKNFALAALVIAFFSILWSCGDAPLDEDNLLITDREECYASNFDLLGADHISVRVGSAEIDDTQGTINITVQYGTDLHHLYPILSVVTDAKVEPKIEGVDDFSDLDHPHQYTVISGNRKVRKTYTVYIKVQQRNK